MNVRGACCRVAPSIFHNSFVKIEGATLMTLAPRFHLLFDANWRILLSIRSNMLIWGIFATRAMQIMFPWCHRWRNSKHIGEPLNIYSRIDGTVYATKTHGHVQKSRHKCRCTSISVSRKMNASPNHMFVCFKITYSSRYHSVFQKYSYVFLFAKHSAFFVNYSLNH